MKHKPKMPYSFVHFVSLKQTLRSITLELENLYPLILSLSACYNFDHNFTLKSNSDSHPKPMTPNPKS